MSESQTQSGLHDDIPLAVVTAHEAVTDNPWINERWTVLGVLPGQAKDAIERRQLRAGPDGEQYLWTGFTLHLRRGEVDSYYHNLLGSNPCLYVYCEHDDSGEPCPRSVTADYIDALSHEEFGNATVAVPIPPEVYRRIEQFVLEHYVPDEPKMKRKHEREPKTSGVWGDE